MKKEISICGHKLGLMSVLFVTLSIIILICLGNWQIIRLKEKENFIKAIETNIANRAIAIDDFDKNIPIYSKITVSGRFLSKKNAFLYGRRSASPEKDGYYLLSAFAADNGNIYMISRGWLPQSVKAQLNHLATTEKSEIIEAIILPGEKKNFLVPENDKENNIWFTLDLVMASEVFATNITNFYLMQIDSQTLPSGVIPLRTTHLNKVQNNHLEYAITWYSLAAAILVMFTISCRKKRMNS